MNAPSRPTQADLQKEIERRSKAPRTSVFTVFNIGTGHKRDEVNNTVAQLYRRCQGTKYINDGPLGVLGQMQGFGMNDKCQATFDAIVAAKPTVVNMTGHSRGAILCHMLAHKLFVSPETQHIRINIVAIDPVHQSKLKHEGAESLDGNPKLMSYTGLIMEHEDAAKLGVAFFPFKQVTAPADVQERMHFINMPGKHGSGTQEATSAIGQTVYQIVAQYLRARGTEFVDSPPTPLDMCDLFAQIHQENVLAADGKSRQIYDDKSDALLHSFKKVSQHSPALRAKAVADALKVDAQRKQVAHNKVLPAQPMSPYLFNADHAFYLRCICPYLFKVLSAAPDKTAFDPDAFARDLAILDSKPALSDTKDILMQQLLLLFKPTA